MSLLTSSDLSKILEAVTILNSGVSGETLPQRTLESVMRLVPNEVTAYDGFDTEGFYDGSLWYSPDEIVPEEVVRHFANLVHEHPNFHHAVTTLDQGTYRMSDFMSESAFHKTTLYNEFYRFFGGDSQILAAMRVSPSTVITCAVHRPRVDFTNAECEMIRLLTPHVKAAFKNAQFVSQMESERRYLSRAVARGVVVLDESGALVYSSQLAERWLRKYFGEIWNGSLPPVVREYVEVQSLAYSTAEYFRPAEPLIVSTGTEELKITVTFDTREREVLIYLEERRAHAIADFERCGVTRREAEILYWIGRGKTDPEIAQLLSISTRTVHKHLEHIFAKLGVETRTAAVMRSLDLID